MSQTTRTIVCIAIPPIRLPAASPRCPDAAAETVMASSGRLPASERSTSPPSSSPSPRRASSASVVFESQMPATHVATAPARNTSTNPGVPRLATRRVSHPLFIRPSIAPSRRAWQCSAGASLTRRDEMPRTPFLRMLRRIADEHREADRLGIPVEAVQEQRYSRADLLKGAGALGVAAALAGPASALAKSSKGSATPRIAIVGGGIAGLNAALTLADAGFTSTIYEANPTRLGGRMHSDSPLVSGGDNYFNGQVAEYCGEFIDSDHNTIISLCKRFGLGLDDVLQVEPNGSTETYFFQNGYYSYKQASLDF